MNDLASEINISAHMIQQSYPNDSKLCAFTKAVSNFTSIAHSALNELNNRVGNQASHINGILLRRGGTVPPYCTVIGTNVKILNHIIRME